MNLRLGDRADNCFARFALLRWENRAALLRWENRAALLRWENRAKRSQESFPYGTKAGRTELSAFAVDTGSKFPDAITSHLQSQSTTLTSRIRFGGSASVSDNVAGELVAAG